MFFLPATLSLIGVLVGPPVASALDNCPHRGKVWGAFLLPLLAMVFPSTQILALLVSFGAALASGLTAHSSRALNFGAVFLTVAAVTSGFQILF